MNILVLGGTLFVGRALVERLLYLGYHNITLLNRGSKQVVFSYPVKTIVADRTDANQMKNALSGDSYDVVFDISGYNAAHLDNSIAALNGRIGYYVFCSSIAVCRQPPAEWPITEEHEKCASLSNSQYGFDKWQAENRLWSNGNSFPASVVRPTYVYGPYNYCRREMFVFESLSRNSTIHLSGDGENIVQFGYVFDLADAMIAMIGNSKAYGQAFNCSGNELVMVKRFISLIAEIMGLNQNIKVVTGSQDKSRLVGLPDVNRYADVGKIRKTLSVESKTTLKDGLMETYCWWQRGK